MTSNSKDRLMSAEPQSGRLFKGLVMYQAALWFLVPLVALVALLAYQMFGGKRDTSTTVTPDQPNPEENHLAQARAALAKKTDLATCRGVVQTLNGHLQKAKEHAVTPLAPSEADKLRALLHLDAGDLAEVNNTSFTPLDAHHLETCLLLREVARTLEIPPVEAGGKTYRHTPLERAAAAFAWVCRQVRLDVPGLEQASAEPAPVAYVLRLGRGGPLERALVFLALVEQFGLEDDDNAGLQGCIILAKGEKGPNLWACGVTVGNKPDAIYLFDPRLGLPLPGPGGKGIATLAQAQQDPSVLGQLKVDKLSYDVTPQDAKQSTISLVCPLSAAAPRMHLLQDRLLRERAWRNQSLPAAVRVRLAEDPARAQATIQAAARSAGSPEVTFSPRGAGMLRHFLPKEEGGSDVPPGGGDPARGRLSQQQMFFLNAVPWGDLPEIFRDAIEFRPENPLGNRLRTMFMGPFIRPLVDPNTPRELVLRGQYTRAVRELDREQQYWQSMRQRLQVAGDLTRGIAEWTQKAIPATAAQIRARGTPEERQANAAAEELWHWKQGDPMEVLLFGAIAGPRGADAMYQLALCRQEQAQRYQMRADLAARAGPPPGGDLSNARKTWGNAEGYWKEYLDTNPGRPGVASARRLRGEAQAMLGQREEAAKSLRDVAGPMTDLEKLGSLWLAKQLAGAKGE